MTDPAETSHPDSVMAEPGWWSCCRLFVSRLVHLVVAQHPVHLGMESAFPIVVPGRGADWVAAFIADASEVEGGAPSVPLAGGLNRYSGVGPARGHTSLRTPRLRRSFFQLCRGATFPAAVCSFGCWRG